jgi:integrase
MNDTEQSSFANKWESFPKITGLIRYKPSGTFFARFKINGVAKRQSLDTTDKPTAVRLLAIKRLEMEQGGLPAAPRPVTMADGFALYEAELVARQELSDSSRRYNRYCVKIIKDMWKVQHGADLELRDPKSVTKIECLLWSKAVGEEYYPGLHNNAVNVARQVFKLAGLSTDTNPMKDVKRLGMPVKQMKLPTMQELDQILGVIETSFVPQAQERADLVRFLAFSGCRISEAAQVLWKHVNWKNKAITIQCAKRKKTSSENRIRLLPIIPAMEQLLQRLMAHGVNPNDRVCKVIVCRKPLVRACKQLGIQHLTHHSFRHLFASCCIESAIDIQTISKWLGHSDGGTLAMRTYGHLNQEHSQKMGLKATFGVTNIEASVNVAELKSANQLQPA